MNNNYRGVRIEFHILQSFPVTCLNRDDVGSPKTAVVGGVERGRISSQCWKRQVRLALKDMGVGRTAVRTKHIADMILSKIPESLREEKRNIVDAVAKVLSDDTLFFMSDNEAKALAEYINDKDKSFSAEKNKKEIFSLMKKASITGFKDLNGLDIALFGRMVANAVELNVEAACSFSHAITTHRISTTADFFSAVDDFQDKDDAGAAHLGLLECTSGTYYRYVSLDVGLLQETLGADADVLKAVEYFTKALYIAVPQARQTTMAGLCPWSYAHVFVRKGQGMQLPFDKPVRSKGSGYLEPSIEEMEKELGMQKKLAGSLWGGLNDFVYGIDENFSIDDLCRGLNDSLSSLEE